MRRKTTTRRAQNKRNNDEEVIDLTLNEEKDEGTLDRARGGEQPPSNDGDKKTQRNHVNCVLNNPEVHQPRETDPGSYQALDIHTRGSQSQNSMDISESGGEEEMDEEVKGLLWEILPSALAQFAAGGDNPNTSTPRSSIQNVREKNGRTRERSELNTGGGSTSPPRTIRDEFDGLTPELWAELKEALKRKGQEQIMFWENILDMLE